ncbi:MAG: choice-of-anchor P family protein [Sinimarinibacterium sp.]|jgi:hypothetical protein
MSTKNIRGTFPRPAFALAAAMLTFSASAHEIVYQGRATAASGNVTVLSQTHKMLIADVGMSCTGDSREEVVAAAQNPAPLALQANDVRSAAQGVDGVAATESGMQEILLEVPGVTISADQIQSFAQAECKSDETVEVSGGSTLNNVNVNGKRITITGEPNQKISIPSVATITFNEQVRYSREFRAVGIHVQLADPSMPASGDVQIAAARAKIKTCEM